MLTFEEFFKKKKIDLAALHRGEPALFTEFASHYDQMGEKSFDHVKKYWFNKLRKQYHLAPEIKADPIRNENQLAEQTVFDSLSAPAESTPKQGFTPRFKAALPKAAEPATPAEEFTDKLAEQATAKPGFTPRFKAGVTKPVEPAESAEEITDKPAEPFATKPGFTPRFKAGVTKPVEPATPAGETADKPVEGNNTATPEAEAPKKPGFTPRFKAGVTKPAEDIADKPAEQSVTTENNTAVAAEEAPKKPGFTPRFKAGVTKPAGQVPSAEDNTAAPEEQKPAVENITDPQEEQVPKKTGFTPRFKAGVTKSAEPTLPAESNTDKPATIAPEPAAKPAVAEEKASAQPLQEADVPEFDFTGKSTPKPLNPVPGKIDKLTEQADRLASDFKSKFKATHLPKHAARLKPGEAAEDNKPAELPAPEQAKNKEVDAKKAAYKPRFNAKKLPPKSTEE